jgi:peptide/nickel transport system permease protein
MLTADGRSAAAEAGQEVTGASVTGLHYQETTMARLVLRQFLRHRLAVISTFVFLAIVASAVFAPLIVRYDPAYIDPTVFDTAPSPAHPLGTDRVGRDILSRLIYGGRVSLSVGVVAVLIFVAIGIFLGSLAGYYGKAVDSTISRFIDIVLSFPQLMLILVLVSLLGPGLRNIMLVIGLLGWPQVARIVRGEFLRLRVQDFVMAARVVGSPNRRIIIRHFLPNAMGPILVAATFGVASSILTESALSFLGLGVQPPTPSWGQMLNEAQSLTILQSKPWLWVPPGIMILVSVLSINFIGDGLRDALDPQLRR